MASSLRADRFIWYVRLIQMLFVLLVLGVTGQSSSVWVNDIGCSTPHRLAWNIACAALTFILLLYFIPTTGPLDLIPFWNTWLQIGLDAIFFILWIAAAATSSPDCSDLCSACSRYDNGSGSWTVWSGNLVCNCWEPSTRGLAGLLKERGAAVSAGKVAEKASTIATKEGFNAVLVLLFGVTLGYSLYEVAYGTGTPRAGAATMQTEEMHQQHQVINKAEAVTRMAA